MTRILFLLRVRADSIAGGVRVIHRHAGWLRQAGFDAAIVNLHGRPTRYHSDAEVISDPSIAIAPTDLLVLPESLGPWIRRQLDLPCRKQVFCQNHHYVFGALEGAPSYAARGIESVYCSSRTIAEFLVRAGLAAEAPVVPYAVDPALFHPEPKAMQIALMPRKLPEQAAFIESAFKARHPRHAAIPWARIDAMGEEETAAIMRRSAVFLHLGWREGFGLPALEAMASGAAVVGFTGGAFDLAVRENGRWLPTEHAVACADALAETVDGLLKGDPATRAMVGAGLRAAAGYSLDRARTALLDRFRGQV